MSFPNPKQIVPSDEVSSSPLCQRIDKNIDRLDNVNKLIGKASQASKRISQSSNISQLVGNILRIGKSLG